MKKILLAANLLAAGFIASAQDAPLTISGSVDSYYKYDFSGYKSSEGMGNIPTSFVYVNNSVSLVMVNVVLSKSVGNASFVGDVSSGPRGQYRSLLNREDGNAFHIHNLY